MGLTAGRSGTDPRRRVVWPGWSQLPREARDTLFLLAVIGWTVLPHLGHLPLWCAGLTAAVLVWRARLALLGATLPGRWVLVAVLALAPRSRSGPSGRCWARSPASRWRLR